MLIPIFISRRRVVQEGAATQVPCATCGGISQHRAWRRYVSVALYFFPMRAADVHGVYACTRCGAEQIGPVPAAAPPMPFLHRFGWLVALLALFAGLCGVMGYGVAERLRAKRARAAWEEREVRKHEAAIAAKAASDAAATASKACFERVQPVLAAAVSKKVTDLKPLHPSDPKSLVNAPFVSIKHASGTGMVIPRGAYFGPGACNVVVPDDVRDYAAGLTGSDDTNPDDVLAHANDLSRSIDAMSAFPVVGVVDYSCPDRACVGVAAWISMGDRRVLAVSRVTKPMNHLGYKDDAEELAPLLRNDTESW